MDVSVQDRDEDDYDPDHYREQDEPDGDWDDRDDYREPDPEDYEIARAYEEYYEHMEKVHGGHQCDCRPTRRERLAWRLRDAGRWLSGLRYRVRNAVRSPWTIRCCGAEVTIRLRAGRQCGACGGQGWAYSLVPGREDLRPPGYNGVSLCGCGSAIAALADSRRYLRRTRTDPPF